MRCGAARRRSGRRSSTTSGARRGSTTTARSHVETVEERRRLVWWWGGDEGFSRVEVELVPLVSGTRVVVTESFPLVPLTAAVHAPALA